MMMYHQSKNVSTLPLLASNRDLLFYSRTRGKCVKIESVLLTRSHPCRTLRDVNNCRPYDYRAIRGEEAKGRLPCIRTAGHATMRPFVSEISSARH